MKLVVDARTFASHPGGIGMYTFDFVKSLLPNDQIELTLLSDVATSREIQFLMDKGIEVITYGKPIFRSFQVMEYFRFVSKCLRRLQLDLFWEPNNLLPMKLRGFSGKVMVTIHDLFPITHPQYFGRIYPPYFKYGIKKALRYADIISYNSKETKHIVEKYYPNAIGIRNFVSYIIVNPPEETSVSSLKTTTGVDLSVPYFLYIGNIENRKGASLLLEAYREYYRQGGRIPLYMGGMVRDEELHPLIDAIRKECPTLHMLGYVEASDKAALFMNCYRFVFPSMAEGFGIPIIEAMYFKRPVLASDLSIFQEIAGDSIEYLSLAGSFEEQKKKLSLALAKEPASISLSDYQAIVSRYTSDTLGPVFAKELLAISSTDSE